MSVELIKVAETRLHTLPWRLVGLSVYPSIHPAVSFLGSGPEGVDDLCFHTYGEFSPSRSSGNWDLGPKAGFWPRGWDLGLEAGIWASRLGFGP